MSNPNPLIKIKRGSGAPPSLKTGELAIDLTNKNLYVGDASEVPFIIGGEGTFATKNYVDSAVSAGTGALGTMSTQDSDDVEITGGSIDGTSIGATTPSTGSFTTLSVSGAPTDTNDVVRKTDLDTAVSALGSVFHFVGDVSAATTPLDLSTLADQSTGAYYRVDVDGTYTSGSDSFEAKVGDAFVKTSTGWQKLDNVDAEVLPTANEISVTGDENLGYTISLDTAFKTRVSDVESKTQNIDLVETVAGTTKINGDIVGAVDKSIYGFIIDGGTYTGV